MGDAPGQLPDSLHLLRVEKRLFRNPQLPCPFFDPTLQSFIQLPEHFLSLTLLRHIETLDENARYLVVFVENGFVYEVQVPLFGDGRGFPNQPDWSAVRDEALAGREDAVQQFKKNLAIDSGHGPAELACRDILAHRPGE